jgi:hypothetical protein
MPARISAWQIAAVKSDLSGSLLSQDATATEGAGFIVSDSTLVSRRKIIRTPVARAQARGSVVRARRR